MSASLDGTRTSSPASRSGLLTAILLLLSLGVSFVLGEVVIRLRYPALTPKHHFRPGIFEPDPEIGYGLRAGYRGHFMEYTRRAPTTINALGYRGPEETPARLAAQLRVAVVGDSIGFGRGVDDGSAYPARLEARLRERGIDAAVFNLGVPGYDSTAERLSFERHVERLDPHVVVLGWYRNDTQPAPTLQVIDGYLIRDEAAYRAWRDRIDERGLRSSALMRWLSVRHKLWRKRLSLERRAARGERSAHERLSTSIAELNRIQDITRSRGAQFVLVVHPAHEEVLTPVQGAATFQALREGVEAGGRRDFTTVLEIAPYWRTLPDEEFYLPGDRCHPNANGHDSIAARLVELPVFSRANGSG